MKSALFNTLRTTTGIVLSVIAAVVMAFLVSGRSSAAFVPLAFAVVLIALSSRFGALMSLGGSIFAALIFASLPTHRPHVADAAGGSSLVWMILIAVAGSYLLFPAPQPSEASRRMHRSSTSSSRQQH